MKVSDYKTFNYKKHFWTPDREYEDLCEKMAIKRLLKHIPQKQKVLLDAGCGFGRMTKTYVNVAEETILLDFALHLLETAKKENTEKTLSFLNGNMYALPIQNNAVSTLVTTRTLHHLPDLETLFSEFRRVISCSGYVILEVPNKRHIINILRFIFKRNTINPFSSEHYLIEEAYANYHPTTVRKLLEKNGFKILKTLSTNFFRHPLFKKILPLSALIYLENFCQKFLSFAKITPSLFYICQLKK